MTIHIVYAHMPDGSRFALKAFSTHVSAVKHVTRCTREPEGDDPCIRYQNPAEILGIMGFSIEPLTVEAV